MDWSSERFGDVCDFVRGPFGGSLKKNIFIEEGYAVYEQQHAIYDQFENVRYFIDADKFSAMSRFELFSGDLIMSCSGTMGKIAIVPEGIKKGIINQALLKLTPKDILLPKFLKLWMESRNFQEQIEDMSQGAAIKNMASVKILKKIKVPLPSITEQRRIVATLDQAFADIEKARANAEQNLKNARKLFDSYLQQVFSQRSGGWTDTDIESLVNAGILDKPIDGNHGEIHPKKADFVEIGVPFIMASDINEGDVDTQNCNFISRSQADTLRKGFAKDGDVLLSHKATIGRSAILSTELDYVMLTPQVTYYRVLDKASLNNEYVYWYFNNPIFLNEMNEYAGVGSTRAYIGITKQRQLKFSYPDMAKQNEIVSKLNYMSKEIVRVEPIYKSKLLALDELKKSLLQKAFSGELAKVLENDTNRGILA